MVRILCCSPVTEGAVGGIFPLCCVLPSHLLVTPKEQKQPEFAALVSDLQQTLTSAESYVTEC